MPKKATATVQPKNVNNKLLQKAAEAKTSSSKPKTPESRGSKSNLKQANNKSGFLSRLCCSCFSSGKTTKNGVKTADIEEEEEEEGEIYQNKSTLKTDKKSRHPTQQQEESPAGSSKVIVNVFQPGQTPPPEVANPYHPDPLRSIRITAADIPKMQSRMGH